MYWTESQSLSNYQILPTLFIHLFQGSLGELRLGYLGLKEIRGWVLI